MIIVQDNLPLGRRLARMPISTKTPLSFDFFKYFNISSNCVLVKGYAYISTILTISSPKVSSGGLFSCISLTSKFSAFHQFTNLNDNNIRHTHLLNQE